MNRQIFHPTQSGVLRSGLLSHLGLLLALGGHMHAEGWLERERTFYQVREDEGVLRVGLVWNGDGPSSPVTVEYATQDLTAKAGEDYVPTAGTLEFAAGDKVKYVTIPILNDSVAEADEAFYVGFDDSTRGWIGAVKILILDNDRSPGVQFESASYWVMADEGALTLRLVRNNDLDHGAFTVDYRTQDGTAVAGQDYVAMVGTLTFAPGELVQSLTIPVLTDGLAEWDREFSVALVNPTGGAFLGTNATARITLVEFAPNPLVPEIIEHVQSADLMGLMRQITGEEPVVVGGDVRTIISRHTTSATLRQATEFVFERFTALGLEAGYQHWDVAQLKDWMQEALGFYISVPGLADRNVLGVKAGLSRSEEIVVVGAHFDSMPESGPTPGADDNASGSAAVLMAAQILSQYEFARTLHFVLFTGEEQGLAGSARYASAAQAGGSNIVAALLPDMIAFHPSGPARGWLFARTNHTGIRVDGPGIPIRFSYPNDLSVASVFTNVVATWMRHELEPMIAQHSGGFWGQSVSDYGSFWAAGFPAVWVQEDSGSSYPSIHTTDDTLQTLNAEYFSAMVKAIVGTAAHLAHPIGRKTLDIIEVANSDWTPDSGIGGGVFRAKHEEGASEIDGDPRDLAWSNAQTNPNQKWLRVQTEPHGVALQTDARPASSETMLQAKLLGGDTTGTGLSCSNQLRFGFLTPPNSNRVYLVRIHVDGRYVAGAADYNCITNLHEVVAVGGFLQLPNLTNLPDGAVYGTCDITARFLNMEPANCRLRITGVSERSVALAATAQLGAHIIDDLEISTNLAFGKDWTLVKSYTNHVSPDAAHFDAGWTEIAREFDPSVLPVGAQFFRLKRTWIHP
jgi:hypothetical protein